MTYIVWTLVLLALAGSQMVGAELPKPQGTLVNDFANVLTLDQRKALEGELRAYEKQTGCEIALVTIPNFEGWGSVEEYASALFKQWGIGKKGVDNGLLIVNAIAERKYRIEVGYGLEGIVTDADAGIIIRNHAITHLKAKDYYGAYRATIEALRGKIGTMTAEERALWKEQQAKEAQKRQTEINEGFLTFLFWLLILGAIGGGAWLIWWIATAKQRAERRRLEAEASRKQEEKMFAAMAAAMATIPYSSSSTRRREERRRSDDSDDDNRRRSSYDPPSHDSGSSGGGFDFGGGSSGGGGATGDY